MMNLDNQSSFPEIQTVEAELDLGAVGRGVAESHFIKCNDGKEYIVKFISLKSLNISRIFANEYIGWGLGHILKCPQPDFRLIHFDEEFASTLSKNYGIDIKAGVYPGSLKVKESHELYGQMAIKFPTPLNSRTIPNIVTFDNWVLNVDRNNDGNLLLSYDGDNPSIFMIDNSHIFGGPSWTSNSLDEIKTRTGLQPIHQYLIDNIEGEKPFNSSLNLLESIPNETIDDFLFSISNTILGDKDAILSSLLNLLTDRKTIVRTIIRSNKNKFPHCSGDLE